LLKKWYSFSFYDAVFIQEAKQALELMGKWEMIDVSDALELLSPVFESEEVIFKRDLWENCNQYGCMCTERNLSINHECNALNTLITEYTYYQHT